MSTDADDKQAFKEVAKLSQHDGHVNAVIIGRKDRRFVTASTDTKVMVFDVEDLEHPKVFQAHTSAVMAMGATKDLQMIISADQSGAVMEWDVISGTCKQAWNVTTGDEIKVGATTSSTAVVSLSIVEKEEKVEREPSSNTPAVAVASATWLVLATRDTIRVKHIGNRFQRVQKGHRNHVSSVCLSQDCRYVVSASWDGLLIVWDAINSTQQRTLLGHTGPVFCCAISDDASVIISGSADTRILIWDRASAKCLYDLRGHHDDPVVDVKKLVPLEPLGTTFASGSQDHKVLVWHMSPPTESGGPPEYPQNVAAVDTAVGVRCLIGFVIGVGHLHLAAMMVPSNSGILLVRRLLEYCTSSQLPR